MASSKGTLDDADIGTGYYVEKTMAEGKDYCERKINLLQSNYDQLLDPPPLPTDDLGPRPPSTSYEPSAEPPRDAPPPPRFDPSRMIGIIRRKALIKDLAAIYHAEGLTYCQQLLELQRKFEEPHIEIKTPEDTRKEMARPTKRMKKTR
ncbi:uncharacterized protein LOC116005036 isoform X2 [Ipomoea triloba]|uniref:uncharacterized protein LOC116005036 isoform X2 n=1 Tax=Ipomoea triloba TaxID=35885 RepID=UPI00125DCE84|nr:uncharacterized protein LOC116005036 isoform X2 [Ipomoea triloba]